jgi:hypothetical protein
VWWCATCALPYTHVAWLNLIGFDRNFSRIVLVFALVGIALLVRKLAHASPGGRRVILPLSFAACFIVGEFAVQIALYGHSVNSWTHPTWFWIVTAAPLSIPRRPRARIALGRRRPRPRGQSRRRAGANAAGLRRDALARALGDPSLDLALWLPERGRMSMRGAGSRAS